MATAPETTNVLDPPVGRRAGGRVAALASATRGWPTALPSLVWLLVWAAVLLAALVGLGTLLAHEGGALRSADTGIVKQLADGRTSTLNSLTRLLTTLAETYTITAIAIIAFVAFRLAFHRWRESLLVLVAVGGEVSVFVLTTLLVERQRPPVPKLDAAPPTSSFPSGHTAAAVVMYGVLALVASGRVRSRPARIAIACLAALVPVAVACARVYRGMHYPTDVVGGALLGLAWLAVAVQAVRLGVIQAAAKGHGGRP